MAVLEPKRVKMIEHKTFDKIDYSIKQLAIDEYDNCTFTDCIFSNTDLSNVEFIECEFVNCDLSSAKIFNTTFREVTFNSCKLLGLAFEKANEFIFSAQFNKCQLNYSSFYSRNLKRQIFNDCNLEEVDFSQSNLSEVVFNNCNLQKAIFENTNLEKADLRTAFNYSIDPDINQIQKAKFSLIGISGLLSKYNIDIID